MIIKKQFKGFSIWGFQDKYEFPISANIRNLKERITKFYIDRNAKPVNKDGLCFIRGKKIWTWFNFWSEFWPYQTIEIKLSNNRIEIIYIIHGGIWLRFPPYHLEKEIIELQKMIGT